MPKRCAFGCPFTTPYHKFPHPENNPESFKIWVQIVGGKLDSPEDYEFYRKKVVCDIHFTDKDRNRNNRLNYLAVPSLHIHGKFEVADISNEISIKVGPVDEGSTISMGMSIVTDESVQVDNLKEVTYAHVDKHSKLRELKPVLPGNCAGNIALEHNYCRLLTKTVEINRNESVQVDNLKEVTYAHVDKHSKLPELKPVLPGNCAGNIALEHNYCRLLTKTVEINRNESVQVDNLKEVTYAHVDKHSKLPELKPVLPGNCAGNIALEHNYCRLLKKTVKINRNKRQQQVSSLLLNQLHTTRSRVKSLQSKLLRLEKKNKTFASRLTSAKKMCTDVLFNTLTNKMTSGAKVFTTMQLTQAGKKRSGRRFSLEEKVLSLSLYKKSPRTYPLLAKLFTLPSTKSLRRLLSKIEVESGLNKCIFLKMKDTVKELSPEDRLCSLIFDEMSISPQIHYNAAKDQLKGFTFDDKKITNHVLVFMVKGLRKKFKQPISYYFTNSINKTELKDILQKVVIYVQRMGLNILSTVCDQSTVNVSVINSLIQDTKKRYLRDGKTWTNDVFIIEKFKVIPLFDVPHLIKGLRNNLLTKDLKYFDVEENVEKVIKWEYFKLVYEADKSYGELKLLQKLTDEHIYIEKIRKMKVKVAAQVFSHSVAAVTEHLSARGDIPVECRSLIKFTKLIDNLFDSLNSNTFNVPNGKIYKACVRRSSPHHALWKNAIEVLKTVTFIKQVKGKNNKIRVIETSSIPSIKKLIRTIEGMQYLWTLLSQTYSFDAMMTRNFNQDPLENFFGSIRSYGARNTAPDVVAFEGAFKSLLITSFNTPHSLHGNCETDDNSYLQYLDFFVTSNKLSVSNITSHDDEEASQNDVFPVVNLNDNVADTGQGNYVCGWVLRKCLQNISKKCKVCRKDMYGDPDHLSNNYIRVKEYNKDKKSLLYPSKGVEKCFIQIQNLISAIINKNIPKKKIKFKIKMFTDIFVDFPFKCEAHKNELNKYFEDTVINILIYSWCRSVNRILSGKMTYRGEDETKLEAQEYYNKRKCIK